MTENYIQNKQLSIFKDMWKISFNEIWQQKELGEMTDSEINYAKHRHTNYFAKHKQTYSN